MNPPLRPPPGRLLFRRTRRFQLSLAPALAYFERAQENYFKQSYVQTLADYNKAIELNYDPLSVPTTIAATSNMSGLQAIEDFSKAIELEYDHRPAPTQQDQRLLLQRLTNDHAIADYDKAIELGTTRSACPTITAGWPTRKRAIMMIGLSLITRKPLS